MRNLILTSLVLSGQFLFAQQLNKASLDSLFSKMDVEQIGSGTVSIMHSGKEVYSKAFGMRDQVHQIPNTPQTIFRIGSITKTFTATLVMKMVEQKKLALTSTLGEFYPQIPNADKITIDQLLQHRSGIYNFTNESDYLQWNVQPMSQTNLLKRIASYSSVFEPGTRMDYSNSNYVLLTFILEKVSKQSYQDLLTKYISKPLQLKSTRVAGPIYVDNNEALSYEWKVDRFILSTETDPSVPLGAGNLVSTTEELNVFLTALMNGKIVNQTSLKVMTSLKDNFGFGLFGSPYSSEKLIGHSGGIDGFNSLFLFNEKDQMSYAVVQNTNQLTSNSILHNLLNATHNKKLIYPVVAKAVKVNRLTLDKYIGDYSTDQIPIEIKVFVDNDGLLNAQATAQSSFPLTPLSNTLYEFAPAKVKIEFSSDGKSLKLLQAGQEFKFTKK